MPHTNYKQMIESIGEIDCFLCKYFTEDIHKINKCPRYTYNDIKSFLKSQAIKSLNNEIEVLESKIDTNPDNYQREETQGYNQALQDHISYLLAQRKLIEEEI